LLVLPRKEKLDTLLKYLLDPENEAPANMDWYDTIKKYVCALLPNFFILYFGQKTPTGGIMSDDVKMAFLTLGKGYEAWCTGAEQAITSSGKIAMVLSNAAEVLQYNEVAFVQKFCDKNWTGKKMNLSADGPILPIILVASDVYSWKLPTSKRTSWRNHSPLLYTLPSIHSPSNTRVNWGRRLKPKMLWLSSCYYVFKEMWT